MPGGRSTPARWSNSSARGESTLPPARTNPPWPIASAVGHRGDAGYAPAIGVRRASVQRTVGTRALTELTGAARAVISNDLIPLLCSVPCPAPRCGDDPRHPPAMALRLCTSRPASTGSSCATPAYSHALRRCRRPSPNCPPGLTGHYGSRPTPPDLCCSTPWSSKGYIDWATNGWGAGHLRRHVALDRPRRVAGRHRRRVLHQRAAPMTSKNYLDDVRRARLDQINSFLDFDRLVPSPAARAEDQPPRQNRSPVHPTCSTIPPLA